MLEFKENHRSVLDPNTSQTSRRSVSPQVRIYNRYFHARQEQRELQEQQKKRQAKLMSNTPKITPNSYMILAQNLCQELNYHITNILNQQEDSSSVSYQTLEQLLAKYIGRHDKDFEVLAEQLYLIFCQYDLEHDQHLVSNLETLFRVLLDPLAHSASQILSVLTKTPCFEHIEQQRQGFINKRPECKAETKSLVDVFNIWRTLRIRYTQFQKKNDVKPEPVPTVKITKKSEILAQKYREKYRPALNSNSNKTTYQHLYKEKLEKDQPKLRTEKDPECTFKPNRSQTNIHDRTGTAKEVVERLYHVPQKSSRDLHQMLEQEQLKKCTFRPQILGDSQSSSRLLRPREVKNFDKSIERQVLARSRKKQEQEAFDRLGKVKRTTTAKEPQVPSMIAKEPRIILEIKVDENRIEKIKLYGNEDPHIVAKKFVLKNGLEDEMVQVVEDLVRDYAQQYL